MSKIHRKFKYKIDQKGIINRYFHEKENWKSHLENTKKFILKSAKNKNNKIAVILGSGWWLDIPVIELSKIFETVFLIDIFHQKEILYKAKKIPNLKFIETDITGLAETVLETVALSQKRNAKKIRLTDLIPKISNFGIPEIIKPDFIVSVNLLNQLDILITSYLKNQNLYSPKEIKDFQKYIQQNHLNSLKVNKTCLITDYKELNFNKNNVLEYENQLVFVDFPKNKFEDNWEWKFDMNGRYNKNLQTIFKVRAIDF